MDGIAISVRKQIKQFQKSIDHYARDQVPFAASLAINDIARQIVAGEKDQIRKTFGPVTPFTLNGFRIKFAKKNDLNAAISLMPIQAGYLDPYEGGGKQVPHISAMLTPKNIGLNQYGNIPYGALKYLKAQKGVFAALKSGNKAALAMAQAKMNSLRTGPNGYFIGPVKTKAGGTIGGLWQRMNYVQSGGIQRKATKRHMKNPAKFPIHRGLKLIIRFTDPVAVKLALHYRDRAKQIVATRFDDALNDAMKIALATRH